MYNCPFVPREQARIESVNYYRLSLHTLKPLIGWVGIKHAQSATVASSLVY